MRFSFNAPVTIVWAAAAVLLTALNPVGVQFMGLDPGLGWTQPARYVQLIGWSMAHSNWDHLLSNLPLFLLLGPLVEKRHGPCATLACFVSTSVVIGVLHVTLSHAILVGASGLVYMLVILAGLDSTRKDGIPLTLPFVAALFLFRDLVGVFQNNQISELAHLAGAGCGLVWGWAWTAAAPPAESTATSK
jgi:membrane associated rhomboid family serine protease